MNTLQKDHDGQSTSRDNNVRGGVKRKLINGTNGTSMANGHNNDIATVSPSRSAKSPKLGTVTNIIAYRSIDSYFQLVINQFLISMR